MKRNMNGYYVCVPLFVCLVLAIELVLAADFKPTDKILLSCGGPAVSTDPDGREWTTDNGSKFGSSTGKSNPTLAATQDPAVPQIPFNSTALQTTSHHLRSTKQPTFVQHNTPPPVTEPPTALNTAYWQPHNRAVSRRIQNMGWRADGGLWLLVRGGGLYLNKGTGITEEFEEVPVQSRGFGILDVGYRSTSEAWAAGGSSFLLRTNNGGKSWIRDKAADNIAVNLYAVKFIDDKKGFVLGNDGVLLRYLG